VRSVTPYDESAGRIIGSAPGFLEALARTGLLAQSDVTILIIGETGTGKELIARSLHYQSARAGKPFVPINCAALPESLIESELFGHEQGAFTDAKRAQRGMVGVSNHGTLMLDEVDSLSAKGQAALLRFLQDGLYRPVGSTEFHRADLRVVAATNSNLEALVEQGRFRRDLFFRLDVATIELPPLRERRDDIVMLAEAFLARFARMHRLVAPPLRDEDREKLRSYRWPGNVRELENAMHRAVLLGGDGVLKLPPRIEAACAQTAAAPAAAAIEFVGSLREVRRRQMHGFEERYLRWLLGETRGNISAAARRARTERRHLGRLIRRIGIDPNAFRW